MLQQPRGSPEAIEMSRGSRGRYGLDTHCKVAIAPAGNRQEHRFKLRIALPRHRHLPAVYHFATMFSQTHARVFAVTGTGMGTRGMECRITVEVEGLVMWLKRALKTIIAVFVLGGIVTGCHFAGHLPPGQVKKVVNPPPGHGGIPPGQLKKY